MNDPGPVPVPVSHNAPDPAPRSPILRYAAVVIIVSAGIVHAFGLATVNDDAFISFRYAQQLVNGNGLVYNPGERVEGYTNFLWTVLIAAGLRFGADPVWFSIVLGIAFTAGTLILVAFFRGRPAGGVGGAGAPFSLIPLAALALVLHRDFNVYATSGLETPMQTFLVTLLFFVLSRRSDTRAFVAAGCVLTASLMTRPDAAVFVAATILFVLVERKDVAKRLAAVGLPLTALFIPYWALRWHYYGFFFPNAFYAKSIDLPYYEQGLTYLGMYVASYYPLLLILPLAILHALGRIPRPGPDREASPGESAGEPGIAASERRAVRLGLLFLVLFTLFVVRIGGDFMFARFLIPVTPMAYLLLEIFILRIPSRNIAWTLATVVVAGTLFRYDHFSGRSQVGHVADEWQRYPLASLDETRRSGAILKRYFDGLPVRVAFWGGQARLVYYAEPHFAIESMAGLTDTAIAHRSIAERGRPGHEKSAPVDYLAGRGVDFYFRPFGPLPPGPPALNLIVFDSLAARILSYRNAVMDSLRKHPGVHFRPMPEFLDEYIATLSSKSPPDVAADVAWFREYYFRHNEDPEREKAFHRFLEGYPGNGPGG